MTKIKVEDKEYDSENLSDQARAYIQALQSCDEELRHLEDEIKIIKVARMSYMKALKEEINRIKNQGRSAADKDLIMKKDDIEDKSPIEVNDSVNKDIMNGKNKKKNGFLGGLFGKGG